MSWFSFPRWWSVVLKEFLQLRRDRITFAMIIGIPLVQLLLFGFAINGDPKHLPTAIIAADDSPFTRSFLTGMDHTGYFHFVRQFATEREGEEALRRGDVQFVVSIPANFTRRLLRGEPPAILIEADATDPSTTGNAINAVRQLAQSALQNDLKGPLLHLAGGRTPFEVRVHGLYNPEGITQYNIVPGLMGVILTMTMVLMTGLAITREREHGTMENMLATPVTPLEVMTGKIVPYIFIGLIQAGIILLSARFLFGVPFLGSLTILFFAILLFIAGNLTIGITLSSLARNQLQAMQMTFFYFLPSILLSGFMFPFRGMPGWAQVLGSLLPLTYFLRVVRNLMLKGDGWLDLWPNLWPLILFTVVVMAIGTRFYRKTLD